MAAKKKQADRTGLEAYAPYAPGWDAKAKSDLVNSALGVDFQPKVKRFSKAKARALLEARPSWLVYLTKAEERQLK